MSPQCTRSITLLDERNKLLFYESIAYLHVTFYHCDLCVGEGTQMGDIVLCGGIDKEGWNGNGDEVRCVSNSRFHHAWDLLSNLSESNATEKEDAFPVHALPRRFCALFLPSNHTPTSPNQSPTSSPSSSRRPRVQMDSVPSRPRLLWLARLRT